MECICQMFHKYSSHILLPRDAHACPTISTISTPFELDEAGLNFSVLAICIYNMFLAYFVFPPIYINIF